MSGLVAVRLIDTARALAGTPPRPVTRSMVVEPAATAPVAEYWLSIVPATAMPAICSATTVVTATMAAATTPASDWCVGVRFMQLCSLRIGDDWGGLWRPNERPDHNLTCQYGDGP